ncbi:hypothetical protein BC748_2820 [Flavobacterium dankookense]|uniref:Uncharacterized protein n=1 Tax=Flavobacterium dankookense TaxID=706186 RepID=A0A4R6Q719_9FLAO|nr:hypothetical protein BC748_2820 [Flavobacterium dankookense]
MINFYFDKTKHKKKSLKNDFDIKNDVVKLFFDIYINVFAV